MPNPFIKRAGLFILSLAFAFSALGSTPARAAGICYVNLSATGANNGASWSNAYTDLQTALTNAATCTEIWVAQGTYRPTLPASRAATFLLVNGVPVFGGFAGTETARDQRNWKTNLTILSGDIDNNDNQNPITNLSTVTGNTTNSYHVVTGVNGAILNGFTITGGYANGTDTNNSGAGMYNVALSASLVNLTLSGNYASNNGGGVYNNGTNIGMSNIAFNANYAFQGGGLYIVNSTSSLTNVTFSNNSTTDRGAGLFNDSSSPRLSNVTFSGNSAGTAGGGMFNYDNSNPIFTNVTFSGNSAGTAGGGMCNQAGSDPTLTNVTFSANSATYGGGMYIGFSRPNFTNVTFSANSATYGGGIYIYNEDLPQPSLKDVLLAHNTGGNCSGSSVDSSSANNLNDDNASCGLTDGVNGNKIGSGYTVNLGPLADNGGFTQTMALLPGSAAIDAGANCASADQRGVTRPQGAACDIGAYEYGANILTVASTSPTANAKVASLSKIVVTFSENAVSDGSAKAANNTANYLLAERGANGVFDTASCAAGLTGDDVAQAIASAAYNSSGFTATLNLVKPLSDGNYRLFICGTTSIWSVAGLELNNGANDTTVDFSVGAASGTGTETGKASALPATGFPMGRVTSLPTQPADKAYSSTDLILEIPALKQKMTIVGVPQSEKSWDVSWLGSNAGWLEGSAFPTWNGNSVLTGHVWDAYNQPGPFANLKSLKYGDQILVRAFGQTYTYAVRDSSLLWGNGGVNTVFKHHSDVYLTLLTCESYNPLTGGYFFRRMVGALLVSVK